MGEVQPTQAGSLEMYTNFFMEEINMEKKVTAGSISALKMELVGNVKVATLVPLAGMNIAKIGNEYIVAEKEAENKEASVFSIYVENEAEDKAVTTKELFKMAVKSNLKRNAYAPAANITEEEAQMAVAIALTVNTADLFKACHGIIKALGNNAEKSAKIKEAKKTIRQALDEAINWENYKYAEKKQISEIINDTVESVDNFNENDKYINEVLTKVATVKTKEQVDEENRIAQAARDEAARERRIQQQASAIKVREELEALAQSLVGLEVFSADGTIHGEVKDYNKITFALSIQQDNGKVVELKIYKAISKEARLAILFNKKSVEDAKFISTKKFKEKYAVIDAAQRSGLKVFDVEELEYNAGFDLSCNCLYGADRNADGEWEHFVKHIKDNSKNEEEK